MRQGSQWGVRQTVWFDSTVPLERCAGRVQPRPQPVGVQKGGEPAGTPTAQEDISRRGEAMLGEQLLNDGVQHRETAKVQRLIGRRVHEGLGATTSEGGTVAVPEDDAIVVCKFRVDCRAAVHQTREGKRLGRKLCGAEAAACPRCTFGLIIAPAATLQVDEP